MPISPVRLLVSDVDGTLVTRDKRLTEPTHAAVGRLRAAGIGFTVVSSRPPVGLKHIVADLGLTLPIGAFNGGTILQPDGTVVEETLVPEPAAAEATRFLAAAGVTVWVFADGQWLITDPDGDYVERERGTIRAEPAVVAAFGPALARAGKIVGACRDTAKLARCESELRARIGREAAVARSQAYYLDVTPPGVDKGTFVGAMSRLLAIPLSAIAVVGDMDNDLPMLDAGGLAIAMGNASDDVKAHADRVTGTNEEDGVAQAIERFILASR